MTKKLLSAALIILGTVAADAKIIAPHCIACNEKILWIDTDKDSNRYYSVGIGAPQEAKSGYYCDPEEKPQCQQKVWAWTDVTISKAKGILLDLHKKGQKNEQQKKIVKNTAGKLRNYFLAAAAKKVPVKQQAAVFNKLISKCNAADFWCAMVQGASMDVIKNYWPEPATSKMRNMAAKVIAKHNKAQAAADRQAGQEMFNTLFTATVDPRSGEPAKQMLSMFMPSGVDIAPKTTITPFAIGRDKTDNSIIFTDKEWFSTDLLKAAAAAGRADVIAYFAKQCEKLTPDINSAIYKSMVEGYGEKEKTLFHAGLELKNLKAKLEKCNTDFDKEEVNKSIAYYNYTVKKNNYKVSAEVAEIILVDMPATAMRKIIAEVIKDLSSEFAGLDIGALMFNTSAAAAQGDAAGAFDAIGNSLDRRLDRDQLQAYAAVADKAVFEKTAQALAASKKPVGKRMKWYADCYKNWTAGTIDPYEIGYLTDAEKGSWSWKVGITSSCGYTSVCIADKEDKLFRAVKWVPGVAVKSRPGYITGKKEKTYTWKAGLADATRIGFVSDKKEGTFVAAPGFVLKDGKAVWTAGVKHPKYKGVVSTNKMFFWMPDKTHLWVNAASGDLSAEKDYKTLSSGAKKGANIAAGIAVSALR